MYNKENIIVNCINDILRIIEKNIERIEIKEFTISGVKLQNLDFSKIEYINKKDDDGNNIIMLKKENKLIINFKYLIV